MIRVDHLIDSRMWADFKNMKKPQLFMEHLHQSCLYKMMFFDVHDDVTITLFKQTPI